MNKDGKADKERGEIDVSLQFYSKNNTTGSVLDLATKKKHLSLKDIKHSLGKSQHDCLSNRNTSLHFIKHANDQCIIQRIKEIIFRVERENIRVNIFCFDYP